MRPAERKKRPTAAMRALVKAIAAMGGRASGAVQISARLTGSAADAWRGLHNAAEGLKVDDSLMLALLLIRGTTAVRKALLDAPREG